MIKIFDYKVNSFWLRSVCASNKYLQFACSLLKLCFFSIILSVFVVGEAL